ncbi:VOC family protein [Phytomonospora sp. NPDC050363]|uniref:VOC family protein n=1 Tax=Phytomonospora sp. NPDC050363 TaxID=3155642 RepID=UPI0033DDB288
MTARIVNVTVNTTDPRALAEWWTKALGGEIIAEHGDFVFASAGPVGLGFQRVDERPASSAMHLDLGCEDRAAEVARLTALGAEHVADHEVPGVTWTIMRDPDGNLFCVSEGH